MMAEPNEPGSSAAPPTLWLSVADIATELAVSQAMVRDLVVRGDLPAIRLGRGRGTYRVSRDELDTWLARHTVSHGETAQAAHEEFQHMTPAPPR